jgi:hypothetical protein
MGKEYLVDSRVGNPSSNSWSCLIRFIICVLHPLISLVMRLLFQILANGYPFSLYSRNFFSSSPQMGPHISSLFKNYFSQVLCKLVPMFYFFKIFVKLHDIDLVGCCIQGCGTLITHFKVWHLSGWHFSYIFLLQFVSKAITTTTTITQMFFNNNDGYKN